MIFQNSHGDYFQRGPGGTYPANNGDPACDVNFDEESFHDQQQRIIDEMLDRMEEE